jgi:hypothetical protein
MHPTILLHQVGWFDGKGIHIHFWGYRSTNLMNNIIVVNNGMLIIYTLHS